MILKNLLRRKGRTFLTILGISIGTAAIIALGAMANSTRTGYNSMLTGSRADLILSQPDAIDISYSVVDEQLVNELRAMPEVAEVSGMLEGFVATQASPYFFIFGYPPESFVLPRFRIIEGEGFSQRELQRKRGKPVLLGSAAAETFKKKPGDVLRLNNSAYRVIGIYQTGDAFEDSGALLELSEAQNLMGKSRQVNLIYIQLKNLGLQNRLQERAARLWKDISLTTAGELGNKQFMSDSLEVFVWVVSGLAILLGGVGMMNAQLMSVYERTHEIGILRAVGWSKWRVMNLILGEAVVVCILGGLLGVGLGWLAVNAVSQQVVLFGMKSSGIPPQLVMQSMLVVLVMGLVGGIYPAWQASRLLPVEALRYEGGTSGSHVRRLPFGGPAMQNLWQRSTRTLLTLSVIGLTVGSIAILDAVIAGTSDQFTGLARGANAEIMVREANIADTSLSAIDERLCDKIAALPEVASTAGMLFTALMLPEGQGFFMVEGYSPSEFGISRFNIIEGEPLSGSHHIIVGKRMADSLHKGVGDSIDLSGSRFKIQGIYTSGISWEEMGGVISLRDAQVFVGRPRKVMLLSVKLHDPTQAEAVTQKINTQFPVVYAALSGEFVSQLPDMKNSNAMSSGMSIMAIFVGGLGVMNTMLMAVLERTREIGVLRALGWRRKQVLGMILRESLLLAFLGSILGVIFGFGLGWALGLTPWYGDAIKLNWSVELFGRALLVALVLGLVGGIYPAYRATRLQPVEALRYE